nr:MAG TPA: hypothetical protein [Caudoviricetes sp.]
MFPILHGVGWAFFLYTYINYNQCKNYTIAALCKRL